MSKMLAKKPPKVDTSVSRWTKGGVIHPGGVRAVMCRSLTHLRHRLHLI